MLQELSKYIFIGSSVNTKWDLEKGTLVLGCPPTRAPYIPHSLAESFANHERMFRLKYRHSTHSCSCFWRSLAFFPSGEVPHRMGFVDVVLRKIMANSYMYVRWQKCLVCLHMESLKTWVHKQAWLRSRRLSREPYGHWMHWKHWPNQWAAEKYVSLNPFPILIGKATTHPVLLGAHDHQSPENKVTF